MLKLMTAVQQHPMLQLLLKKAKNEKTSLHVERIAFLVKPCCNAGCQCWWNVILTFSSFSKVKNN